MAYRFTINDEEKFVRFDLSGELTGEDIGGAIADLQRVREEHKLRHVLCVETDLKMWPSDVVGFRTAETLSSGPFVGLKVAIVRTDTSEEHLFEIAANNRGAVAEVFDDEGKAINWLRAG